MLESNSALASRLQLAAIRLLRRLKQEETAVALSPSQLSALNRLVREGPMTLTDLAAAERVTKPTMTRVVQGLERQGLVMRILAVDDRRVRWIEATHRAWVKLEESRTLRVLTLVEGLARLTDEDKEILHRAVQIVEKLSDTPSQLPKPSPR